MAILQAILNEASVPIVIALDYTAENGLLGLKPIGQCLEFFSEDRYQVDKLL